MSEQKKLILGAIIWSIFSSILTFTVIALGSREISASKIALEMWRFAALLTACNFFLTFLLIKLNK